MMNSNNPGPEKEKARTVVQLLGSNSVPLLLDWLNEEDRPSLGYRINDARASFSFWLMRHHILANDSVSSHYHGQPPHSLLAVWALPELSPEAKRSAVPTLIQRLGDKDQDTNQCSLSAGSSYLALKKMAPESIDPLIKALSSHDRQTRLLAAGTLGEIGTSAKAAIPVLEKSLTDTDPQVRASIAIDIGKLGGDTDVFVPVLIRTLPDLDPEGVDYALNGLLDNKEHAKSAIPVLLAIVDKFDRSTDEARLWLHPNVLEAIKQIDPNYTNMPAK